MQSFLHGFHSYRLISWNKIIGVQPTHPGSRVSAYQTPARLDAAAVIDDSIVEVDEQCPRRIHSFGPLETTICLPIQPKLVVLPSVLMEKQVHRQSRRNVLGCTTVYQAITYEFSTPPIETSMRRFSILSSWVGLDVPNGELFVGRS